ncbi:LamG-like jellyroll fold domain-containing protein [Paraburkholderia sp. J10-1]|uniref:LamG-like jellyroll fold domain-containing protein n=1 Tax=Paraburkholderia sp. J10-1 TaxID=2805430 RepID=UPI002AB66D4E|nr:LamG-like jellyroll fold domain-containing protein [Paraburkholderia sp. J10-1]
MSRLAKRLLMAGSANYAGVVLADGPYAYWRLDETSGTVAADSSGNHRDGLYVAPVQLAETKLLPASPSTAYVALSGSGSGYIDVSAASQFCAGNDWSFECWIDVFSFAQSAGNMGCTIMAGLSAPGGTTGWAFGGSASPSGSLMYYTKSYSNLGISTKLPVGRTYLAAVRTGANRTLAVYLNGQLAGSQTYGQALAPVIEPGLYIGEASTIAAMLDGVIGEFAVYNCALTDDQILRHYSAGMGGTPAFSGVLDRLTAAPVAAWSLRRLGSHYSGPCINVRRDADDAKLDIGFTPAGDPDLATLLAFVGSANGCVATWYDQTGNALHLSQSITDRQPLIVTSGVLNTMSPGSRRPGILATASACSLQELLATGSKLNLSQPFTRASVNGIPSGAASTSFSILTGSTNTSIIALNAVNLKYQLYDYSTGLTSTKTVNAGSANCVMENYNGASSSLTVNGTTTGGSIGTDGINITAVGALTGMAGATATFGEVLQFGALLSSADQTTLTTNQQAWWGAAAI